MEIYEVNEMVAVVDNVPGTLYRISSVLSSSGLNIEAINAYVKDPKTAVFRIITADPETARKMIGKSGLTLKSLDVGKALVVKLMDRPGELMKLTEKMYKNSIDIETLYIIGRSGGYTEVAIRAAADHGKLSKLLGG